MSAVDTTYTSSTGENYYTSSTQETEDANKEIVSGEQDNVTHEDFLMLLVTQMQNQDPLNPMQDTEMMSQFAQLQQLDNQKAMTEAMLDMRREYAVQGASSMIGKEVTSKNLEGAEVTGIVVNTFTDDDENVRLTLDSGDVVTYKDISKVKDMAELPDINAASSMMEKYVVGVDENAKAFEGIVKNITTKNGQIYLNTYEGDSIPMIGVAQVRDLTSAEKSELDDAVALLNQYVESEQLDEDGNPDGVKSGIVKDVFRKDGQYWVETWGGQGIYIKDIDTHQNLTTEQMKDMEECKEYVDRFIKANDGNMAGIVEGFFFKDDQFYLYTSRGEAVSSNDVYSVRDATSSDWEDYGSVDDMSELLILNLQKSIETHLGKSFSGYTPSNEPISGTVNSVYYKRGYDGKIAIMFGLEEGGEAISPASLVGV